METESLKTGGTQIVFPGGQFLTGGGTKGTPIWSETAFSAIRPRAKTHKIGGRADLSSPPQSWTLDLRNRSKKVLQVLIIPSLLSLHIKLEMQNKKYK